METVPFEAEFLGGLIGGFLAGILALVLISAIFVYIYTSWAHMSIAKRVSLSHPGIAWIPYFGPIIIAFRISKMHWWPWLIFVAAVLLSIGTEATELAEAIGTFTILLNVLNLVFWVFVIIWSWKMFEALRRPGWWALMLIVPIIGWIIYLVFLGIAAWGKSPQGPREGGNQFTVGNNPQVSETPQTPETSENHSTSPSDR